MPRLSSRTVSWVARLAAHRRAGSCVAAPFAALADAPPVTSCRGSLIDRLGVDGHCRQSQVLIPDGSRPTLLKPFLRFLNERLVSNRKAAGTHGIEDPAVVFQEARVRVGSITAASRCMN